MREDGYQKMITVLKDYRDKINIIIKANQEYINVINQKIVALKLAFEEKKINLDTYIKTLNKLKIELMKKGFNVRQIDDILVDIDPNALYDDVKFDDIKIKRGYINILFYILSLGGIITLGIALAIKIIN